MHMHERASDCNCDVRNFCHSQLFMQSCSCQEASNDMKTFMCDRQKTTKPPGNEKKRGEEDSKPGRSVRKRRKRVKTPASGKRARVTPRKLFQDHKLGGSG